MKPNVGCDEPAGDVNAGLRTGNLNLRGNRGVATGMDRQWSAFDFVRYRLTPQWLRDRINPISEIHIECLDKTEAKLVKWARKNENAMLMFMPQHRNKVQHVLSVVNNPVGLHVHICDDVYTDALPLPDYSKQFEKIREGLDFLEDLKPQVTDFASGHWSYDYNTFKSCKELGLTRVHVKCKIIPTTLSCGIPDGINIIPIHKHLHDYDLIGGLKCSKP
jgi:hypothetical protein